MSGAFGVLAQGAGRQHSIAGDVSPRRNISKPEIVDVPPEVHKGAVFVGQAFLPARARGTSARLKSWTSEIGHKETQKRQKYFAAKKARTAKKYRLVVMHSFLLSLFFLRRNLCLCFRLSCVSWWERIFHVLADATGF
jgi:hypothetical protein